MRYRVCIYVSFIIIIIIDSYFYYQKTKVKGTSHIIFFCYVRIQYIIINKTLFFMIIFLIVFDIYNLLSILFLSNLL